MQKKYYVMQLYIWSFNSCRYSMILVDGKFKLITVNEKSKNTIMGGLDISHAELWGKKHCFWYYIISLIKLSLR